MFVISSFHIVGFRDPSFVADLDVHGTEELEVLIDLYGALLDTESVRRKFRDVKHLMLQCKYVRTKFVTMWQVIAANHAARHPNIMKLVQLALVLPLQTTSCWRGILRKISPRAHTAHGWAKKTLNDLMMNQWSQPQKFWSSVSSPALEDEGE